MIHHGDLFDVLPTLPEASVDACVTDPPYELTNRTMDVLGCSSCGRTLGGSDGRPTECPRCGGVLTRQRSAQGKGFMGMKWDGTGVAFKPETWTAVLRVLKPGAYLLAFGGTRTFHRMTCAIEDAGFEIRDCLSYLYGSGFPKSLNIGCKCRGNAVSYSHAKQIPERDVRFLLDADVSETVNAGNEPGEILLASVPEQGAPTHGQADGAGVDAWREQSSVEGRELYRAAEGVSDDPNTRSSEGASERLRSRAHRHSGADSRATVEAERGSSSQGPGPSEQRSGQSANLRFPSGTLDGGASERGACCARCGGIKAARGQGTALKPAWEPIILARKPFSGTVAENVTRHGTAALNIDACRINPGELIPGGGNGKAHNGGGICAFETRGTRPIVEPHDDGRWPANVLLDEEAAAMLDEQTGELISGANPTSRSSDKFRDTYSAFKGQAECIAARGMDVGGASRFYYVAKPSREERDFGCHSAGVGRTGGARNIHPTVKPVALMRWLVRLVTPTGGLVLDPFTGSGTTGMACRYEQRKFIGIEREADYIAIAERRIAAVAPLFGEQAC